MILEVAEGLRYQTSDEELIYKITTTNWGSSPSVTAATAAKVYQLPMLTDVTTTMLPTNSTTASGDVITLSPLKALVAGNTYRVDVKFTSGSNVFECYFLVKCEI